MGKITSMGVGRVSLRRRWSLNLLLGLWMLSLGAPVLASESAAPVKEQPQSASSVVSVPPLWTLAETLAVFKKQGFALLLSDIEVQLAAGEIKSEGAITNPQFNFGYGKSWTLGPCQENPWGLGGGQQFSDEHYCFDYPALFNLSLSDQGALSQFLSGKRGLKIQVAKQAWSLAKYNQADQERLLVNECKKQFLQTLLADRVLTLASDIQKAALKMFELVKARYQAGAVSEADVARLETALLTTEQALTNARQDRAVAHYALAYLLGFRNPEPYEFRLAGDEFLHYALPPVFLKETELNHTLKGADRELITQHLWQQALSKRPDVLASKLALEKNLTALSLAKRRFIPDIALNVGYLEQGTNKTAFSPPTVTLGLEVELPIFYQQQGEIFKARVEEQRGLILVRELESRLLSEVKTAYHNFLAAEELLQRMEDKMLERAKRARDLVLIQYSKGAASLLEFLDAERTYITVNMDYLQNLRLYWSTVFDLEQALGVDLR